ncbi:MAG: AAA family ATPase [Caldilineaceae bacterium]
MPKKRVVYGLANYAEQVQKNGYLVDKTEYIQRLELIENPVFLRPRRFGKSMFCSLLNYYYDLNEAARFDALFGHTWIGQHPTGNQNRYMILYLNFSTIATGPTLAAIEHSFKLKCNASFDNLRYPYAAYLGEMPPLAEDEAVADNLGKLLDQVRQRRLPPLYVIIDEYDNFANHLITTNKDQLYYALTADDSFFKAFFKTLKEGRETGALANIFITGILPITIDDLASAFNVGTFLTLDADFEAMAGFTQREVDQLLDAVYVDYELDPTTRPEIAALIKNHYNGYHFVAPEGEALYNSTSLMYFLQELTRHKRPPEFLTDLNLRTDLYWVRRLTGANPGQTETFIDTLTTENRIAYDRTVLRTKFNMFQFFEPGFYPIAFFYLGMLTLEDKFFLKLPNVNLRQIMAEYFNELHQIDVSTRYAEMMQAFVNQPNLETLFANYWKLYISQLPEAIFQKVNENFYRTTFFELCSRYLSPWFTWHIERSYPQGKSDLEFVGKYNERFANLRWVIEFKYYSNADFRQFKTTLSAFQLQPEDTTQIAGYAEGLRQEFPSAQIEQFVIYCIGNQGFRVFHIV